MNRAERRARDQRRAAKLAQALRDAPPPFYGTSIAQQIKAQQAIANAALKMEMDVVKARIEAKRLDNSAFAGVRGVVLAKDEAQQFAEALAYEPPMLAGFKDIADITADALTYGVGMALATPEIGCVESVRWIEADKVYVAQPPIVCDKDAEELAQALAYEAPKAITLDQIKSAVDKMKANPVPGKYVVHLPGKRCGKSYMAEVLVSLGVPATKNSADKLAFANGSEVRFV